ncbi:hypothetical protein [Streptomyces sp. NPDC047043]|uniref:hypothetical protein n=1 Tax=Streptomyces sp. NPDC047043 TaxID=3154497 RepID=UPI0034016B3E
MRWGRAAAAAGLMFLLTSCGAEFDPLYVEGDAAGPVIGWRDCPGADPDGIDEVGLYTWDRSSTVDEPGELLWRIKSDHGALLHRLRLGSTPKGFTTLHALTTTLEPGTTYALRTNMKSEDLVSGFLTFRPGQLSAGSGRIVFDSGKAESRKQYEARDDEDFGCFSD